jgi:hypothetical protein
MCEPTKLSIASAPASTNCSPLCGVIGSVSRLPRIRAPGRHLPEGALSNAKLRASAFPLKRGVNGVASRLSPTEMPVSATC